MLISTFCGVWREFNDRGLTELQILYLMKNDPFSYVCIKAHQLNTDKVFFDKTFKIKDLKIY